MSYKKINENKLEIDQLFEINIHKLDKKSIDPSKKYQYIEISCVDIDSGAIIPKIILGNEIPVRGRLVGKSGDIILGLVRPKNGICAIIPESLDNCIVSSAFAVLTPKKIKSEELFRALKKDNVKKELGLIASGTSVPTLSIEDLKKYILSLESEDWSSKISELNIKERRDQFNSLKNVSDIANEEFKKLRNKKSAQDMILEKLGELIIKIKTGVNVSKYELDIKGIPFIKISDMLDTDDITDTINTKNFISKGNLSGGIAENDEILVPRILKGKTRSYVIQEGKKVIANHHLFIIEADTKKIHPDFLAYYFRTQYFEESVKSAVKESSSTITIKLMKNILIPVPPLESQKKISTEIKKIIDQQKIKKDFTMNQERFSWAKKISEQISDEICKGSTAYLVSQPVGTGKTQTMLLLIENMLHKNHIKKIFLVTAFKALKEEYMSRLKLLHLETYVEVINKEEMELYEKENNDSQVYFIIDSSSLIDLNNIKLKKRVSYIIFGSKDFKVEILKEGKNGKK